MGVHIVGEDIENYWEEWSHVTRHCNISHLSGAKNEILMERWLRLKTTCGFGFVLWCKQTCTYQGLYTLPMSLGWLAAISPVIDRAVGANPSLQGSRQLNFSSETYRQKILVSLKHVILINSTSACWKSCPMTPSDFCSYCSPRKREVGIRKQ